MGYYDDLKRMADSTGMPESELNNTIAFSDTIAATVLKWSKKIIMLKQEVLKNTL